jgi:hypothetical protein
MNVVSKKFTADPVTCLILSKWKYHHAQCWNSAQFVFFHIRIPTWTTKTIQYVGWFTPSLICSSENAKTRRDDKVWPCRVFEYLNFLMGDFPMIRHGVILHQKMRHQEGTKQFKYLNFWGENTKPPKKKNGVSRT